MLSVEDLVVISRNGKERKYNREKIERAVTAAFTKVYEDSHPDVVEHITECVENVMRGRRSKKTKVETVQDIVETQIMASGFPEAAREYVLFRHYKQQLRNQRMNPDSEAVADFIAVSKYARYRSDLGRRESWTEAVQRVEDMHLRRFPEIKDIIKKAFNSVRAKRVLAAGRHMQFGGVAIEANNARGYNCAGLFMDKPETFSWVMWLLLSGAGAGIDVCYESVDKLPPVSGIIDESDVRHFTIPDTIEGWADAVNELIESYINGYLVEFNYSKIRPRGVPLKISGGKAPGHVPLRKALERSRAVLNKALGRKMKPIEVFDICMHISDAVLSGGIRRAAILALFSPDDGEMMMAKMGNWFEENPQRARANISVRLIRDEVTKPQFLRTVSRLKEYSEPGFYLTDSPNYIINPCAEIGMHPILETGETGVGFCNLVEINGSVLRSEREFKTSVWAATVIATLQAAYTDFTYLGEVSKKIAERDALIGVSITGQMDNPDICLNPDIQRRMAEYVLEVNEEIARKIGINPAKRATTVKPGGTSSKLLGFVSAGSHPQWAKRFFSRIRCNKDEPPFQHFRESNPHACEQSLDNDRDEVITFCIQAPEKAITWADVSALDMLESIRNTQNNWIVPGTRDTSEPSLTHSVSNTVLVEEHEWEEAAEYIWKYRRELVGVTLMEKDNNRYPQAPLQTVVTQEDELKWNHIIENYKPVDYTEMKEENDTTALSQQSECDGAACVLK